MIRIAIDPPSPQAQYVIVRIFLSIPRRKLVFTVPANTLFTKDERLLGVDTPA